MARQPVNPNKRSTGSPARRLHLLAALPLLGFLLAGAVLPAPTLAAPGTPAVRFTGRLSFGERAAPRGTVVKAITARSVNDFTACGTGRVGANGSYTLDVPAIADCGYRESEGCCDTFIFIAQEQNVGVCVHSTDLDQPGNLGRTHAGCNLFGAVLGYRPPPATGFPLHAVLFYGRYTHNQVAQGDEDLRAYANRGGADYVWCGRTTTDRNGNYGIAVPAKAACARPKVTGDYTVYYRDGAWLPIQTCHFEADIRRPETLGRPQSCNLFR